MKESSRGMVEAEYFLVEEEERNLPSPGPYLNDSCVGPHGALTLLIWKTQM